MITNIRVINRRAAEQLVNGAWSNVPKSWYMVSICSTNSDGTADWMVTEKDRQKLNGLGCVEFLSLNFDDITSEVYEKIKHRYPYVKMITQDQANQIWTLLQKANANLEDTNLIAHCDAGVSRSGAVGTFVADYFGVPFDYNTVYPNPRVLQMLKKSSGATEALLKCFLRKE